MSTSHYMGYIEIILCFLQSYLNKSTNSSTSETVVCYCRDHDGHKVKGKRSTALNAKYSKCDIVGHFAGVCNQREKSTSQKEKTVVESVVDEPIFFVVSSNFEPADELVLCHVGGKPFPTFIDAETAGERAKALMTKN